MRKRNWNIDRVLHEEDATLVQTKQKIRVHETIHNKSVTIYSLHFVPGCFTDFRRNDISFRPIVQENYYPTDSSSGEEEEEVEETVEKEKVAEEEEEVVVKEEDVDQVCVNAFLKFKCRKTTDY